MRRDECLYYYKEIIKHERMDGCVRGGSSKKRLDTSIV